MVRNIYLDFPDFYTLKISLVKRKKQKKQTLKKILFDSQPNGKIYLGKKSYKISGEKTFSAIKFLASQNNFSATAADFLKEIYDETPPDRPKAIRFDSQEKIKTLNRELKKKQFPGRIRIKNEIIFLDF